MDEKYKMPVFHAAEPKGCAPELPANFCRIKEPDNPDFDERFACKDCGENFITMCSYARLKAQLQAAEVNLERAEKIAEQTKQQAEIWAQEARTHRDSLLEAYKAVGAAGLADFHGAEPIREYVQAAEAKLAAVTACKPIAEEELERLMFKFPTPWSEFNQGWNEALDTVLSRLREVQSQGNTEKGGKK